MSVAAACSRIMFSKGNMAGADNGRAQGQKQGRQSDTNSQLNHKKSNSQRQDVHTGNNVLLSQAWNDQKLSMFNNQSILWVCVEFILRVLSTAAHQEDIWSGQASTTAATTKHQTCRCLCQKSSRTLEGTYWRVANTLHYISNLYKECQHCLMTECQTTDVHVCQSRTWPDM